MMVYYNRKIITIYCKLKKGGYYMNGTLLRTIAFVISFLATGKIMSFIPLNPDLFLIEFVVLFSLLTFIFIKVCDIITKK